MLNTKYIGMDIHKETTLSGSDAVVSCLTMYMATCREKAIARVLLRTSRSCSRRLKCSLTRFWIRSIVTRFSWDATFPQRSSQQQAL